MSEDFREALILLAVGMITVGVILTFVVIAGNLLIRFVNKYLPDELKTLAPITKQQSSDTDPRKVSAILAAVDIVTGGKGKVTSIKPVEK